MLWFGNAQADIRITDDDGAIIPQLFRPLCLVENDQQLFVMLAKQCGGNKRPERTGNAVQQYGL